MTHFGLICLPGSGHLNPMTTLGYELKKRGHQVTLFGIPDAKSKTLAAGLEFCEVGSQQLPIGTMAEYSAQIGVRSGLAALRYNINFFTQEAKVLFEEMPKAIQAAQVEMLLVDQASPTGGTIAEYLDIPFITVCCCLMFNQESKIPPVISSWQYNPAGWAKLRNRLGNRVFNRFSKPARDVVIEYRQQWNLPPRYSSSKLAQICQQPAEFEFPRENLPSCFHFTGPYNNPISREPAPFPWEKLTGQPLIYASMGTVQNRLIRVFQTIAAACADLDAQLIISLGGSAKPDALPKLVGSPLVVEYAPQLELLSKSALTITHAGLNTTLESLSNGVPMVAIPIANDQPAVAARIKWTGTGEAIPLNKLTTRKLQKAVKQVLTEDSYKKNALRLQMAIRQAGGVSRAADIIEQVVATGKPVVASHN